MNDYSLIHAILGYMRDLFLVTGEERVTRGGVSIYEIAQAPGGPKLSHDVVRRAAQRAIDEEVGWLAWGPVLGIDAHGAERRNLVLTPAGLDFIKSIHFKKQSALFSSAMGYEMKPRRTR